MPTSLSTRTVQQSGPVVCSLTFEAPKVKEEGLDRERGGRGELVKAASEPGVTMGGQHRASQAGLRDGCLLVVFRRSSTGNWLTFHTFLQILSRESSRTPVINFSGPRETHSPSAHCHLCGTGGERERGKCEGEKQKEEE